MYKVLLDGGAEAFINHVKIHKIMLADCKVKDEAVAARFLILANWRDIATLTVANSVTNHKEINNLVEAGCELNDTVCTSQKNVFYYFENFFHRHWP